MTCTRRPGIHKLCLVWVGPNIIVDSKLESEFILKDLNQMSQETVHVQLMMPTHKIWFGCSSKGARIAVVVPKLQNAAHLEDCEGTRERKEI